MRRRLMASQERKLYLYKAGDKCVAVTGGWEAKIVPGGTHTQSFKAIYNTESVYLQNQSYSGGGIWLTKNSIDFTKYSKLCIDLECRTRRTYGEVGSVYPNVLFVSGSSGYFNGIKEIDISNLTGAVQIGLRLFSYSLSKEAYKSDSTVRNIWLEK